MRLVRTSAVIAFVSSATLFVPADAHAAPGNTPEAAPATASRDLATVSPRALALEVAVDLARATIANCQAKGYKVAVTIVDSAGGTRLVLAQDGVRQQAVDSGGAKAYTVIRFQQSSGAVAQKAAADPDFAKEIAADAKLRARAGGLPLTVAGQIIGAIGVGGAPGGEKDEACAVDAIASVGDRLR